MSFANYLKNKIIAGGSSGGSGTVDLTTQGSKVVDLPTITTLANSAYLLASDDGGQTISKITKANAQASLSGGAVSTLTFASMVSAIQSVATNVVYNFANGAPTGVNVKIDGSAITLNSAPTINATGTGANASGTVTFNMNNPATLGSHTLSVSSTGPYAIDAADQTFTVTSASAPTLTWASQTTLTGGVTSTYTYNFANGAPTNIVALIDGVSTTVSNKVVNATGSGATATGTVTFDITNPAAGSHTLSVSSTGGAYNATAPDKTQTYASGAPAYVITQYNNEWPANGARTVTGTNMGYYASATVGGGDIHVYIKTAGGVTPAGVNFMWSQDPNNPPCTYNAAGGDVAHANDRKAANRTGGWVQGGPTGQDFNGLYGPTASMYMWGPAGDYYLWIITDDGFKDVVRDSQGNPKKVTVT